MSVLETQALKEKVDSLMKAGKLLAVDHDMLKVRVLPMFVSSVSCWQTHLLLW